jgi:hypothetical protein
MTKLDDAWNRFFADTNLLVEINESGYCRITADALKRYREPRLMAKIDTLAERPDIFVKNNLALFPTRNGEYIIFRDRQNKTYYRFGNEFQNLPIQQYESTVDLFAFNSFPGYQVLNESQAIDFAFISSLLTHFTGDGQLSLTIRGRNFSDSFYFLLPDSGGRVDVTSVQIEIDAGYESPQAIYLIEAKVGQRSDFNIRQLYYPYLNWSSRSQKKIVPIFLAFTNGKYYLTEFRFAQNFGELSVVRNECYVINENPRPQLPLGSLLAETANTWLSHHANVPFPQADDLDKVLDTVSAVDEGVNSRNQLADFFEFDERQGDYYANAASYLGFLSRDTNGFFVTDVGKDYLSLRSRKQRMEMIVRQLLTTPTFHQVLELVQERGLALLQIQPSEVARIIESNTNLTGTTSKRRAQTVRSWLKWLHQNVDLQSQ